MDELTAFLATLDQTAPDTPTRCPGWTAHELLAHLVAGTEEMLRLSEHALVGGADQSTKSFDEREAPWRQRCDQELRVAFLEIGGRFLITLDALPPDVLVPFTGWAMTVDELRAHGRSELALHRWDLIGDDEIGRRLLSQPDLLEHGRKALSSMPGLPEARRIPEQTDGLLAMWGRSAT